MNTESIIGVFSAVGAVALGVLTWRRSTQVDAVAARLGVTAETREGASQIIQGLSTLAENLQEDNVGTRAEIKYMTTRFEKLVTAQEECKAEVARLRRLLDEHNIDF